jgi:hypothetical protein
VERGRAHDRASSAAGACGVSVGYRRWPSSALRLAAHAAAEAARRGGGVSAPGLLTRGGGTWRGWRRAARCGKRRGWRRGRRTAARALVGRPRGSSATRSSPHVWNVGTPALGAEIAAGGVRRRPRGGGASGGAPRGSGPVGGWFGMGRYGGWLVWYGGVRLGVVRDAECWRGCLFNSSGNHGVWRCEESGDGGGPRGRGRRRCSSSLRSAHRLCGPCGRGGAWRR